MARPVPFITGTRQTERLAPGFKGVTCTFEWRPFEKRSAAEQADWLALRDSIRRHGILNPLICWGDRVLIGMRRWEIAMREGIGVVPVAEILEDPSHWRIGDVRRLRDMLQATGVWARLESAPAMTRS